MIKKLLNITLGSIIIVIFYFMLCLLPNFNINILVKAVSFPDSNIFSYNAIIDETKYTLNNNRFYNTVNNFSTGTTNYKEIRNLNEYGLEYNTTYKLCNFTNLTNNQYLLIESRILSSWSISEELELTNGCSTFNTGNPYNKSNFTLYLMNPNNVNVTYDKLELMLLKETDPTPTEYYEANFNGMMLVNKFNIGNSSSSSISKKFLYYCNNIYDTNIIYMPSAFNVSVPGNGNVSNSGYMRCYMPFEIINNNINNTFYFGIMNYDTQNTNLYLNKVYSFTLYRFTENYQSKNTMLYNSLFFSGFNQKLETSFNDSISINFQNDNNDEEEQATSTLYFNKGINLSNDYLYNVNLTGTFDLKTYDFYTTYIVYDKVNNDLTQSNIDSYQWIVNTGDLKYTILNNNNFSPSTPSSNEEFEKYNTCQAWYDIPCQLGNGLTYVIYNVPIIGPLINFIKTLIVGVSSMIDIFDIFSGFGIIFSIFIIFIAYCIIRKIYNK